MRGERIKQETILIRKIERFEVIANGEATELSLEEFEAFFEKLKSECYKLSFRDTTYNGRKYVKVICEKYVSEPRVSIWL